MSAVKGQKPHRGKTMSIAEMRRLAEANLSWADIGKILNVSDRSACNRLKARGISKAKAPKKRTYDADTVATAVQLYRDNVRMDDIEATTGLSGALIRQRAREAGVPPRRREDRAGLMTLADYRTRQIVESMAKDAKHEQRAARTMWEQGRAA